ncbi:MAG: hypothetical protein JO036_17285 [Candidatus Eremiobacteraeota bacterium]|nr:hypothetical protein [Candidatus Eremiobacteraeota bacterium]
MNTLTTANLLKYRAEQGRNRRKVVQQLLNALAPQTGDSAALRSLANTFSRYAQTSQTAYETGVAGATGGTTSTLERTVENAVTQVLGRAPGANGGFVGALVDAFPTVSDGTVASGPTRTLVSLIGTGPASLDASNAAGLSGQISAEQATLYRQASIIVPDARRVLAGITPFATVDQPDVVESLRGLIDSSLATLLEEFSRVDEPRAALVNDYLQSLRGATGFVQQFGVLGKVNGFPPPDAYSDEQQIAGFRLLGSYVTQLDTAWQAYRGPRSTAPPLFTERLARASQTLSVIAQANVNFKSAMDAVGFPETERRSVAARFIHLDTQARPYGKGLDGETRLRDLVAGKLRYSELTVDDYNAWVEKLAQNDGPRLLADAGQYGLEFVTAQADTLYFTIAPVQFFVKRMMRKGGIAGQPIVAQVLTHERVAWALDDLFMQLDALADLAA